MFLFLNIVLCVQTPGTVAAQFIMVQCLLVFTLQQSNNTTVIIHSTVSTYMKQIVHFHWICIILLRIQQEIFTVILKSKLLQTTQIYHSFLIKINGFYFGTRGKSIFAYSRLLRPQACEERFVIHAMRA